MLRIVVDPVAMKISGLLVAMSSYIASQSTEIEWPLALFISSERPTFQGRSEIRPVASIGGALI